MRVAVFMADKVEQSGLLSDKSTEASEETLDGVRYALLGESGSQWCMGTTNPLWRQRLPLTEQPSAAETERLAQEGIWLARRNLSTPHLAVMCCGQGTVWAGMGRELYDSFPAARDAMDRLAACSNWDVLALMDETDLETIGLTRWQQPYLFLLEYAQWSLYASLGLQADLFCGHSLGELIALCLSGIYSPEACWHIMDTRSRHTAELEARASREMGMMAVYAGREEVAAVQAQWPELYISNFNTPRQFILSGPRELLSEARRALRKRHLPAILLNVTMAFHHPSMRVLRELSFRRLNGLDMHSPSVPVLSCVTAGFYPNTQSEICRYIVDLDENCVRWVDCVQNMWNRDGIRNFLELGPQDTLCALVGEIEPAASCLASSAKGHERETMRRTLAQLYASGYLPHSTIRAACERRRKSPAPSAAANGKKVEAQVAPVKHDATEASDLPAAQAAGVSEQYASTLVLVQELLAKACARTPDAISEGLDLRFDLALHSSFFPRIIDEAEKKLGKPVRFDELVGVSTVGDLTRVLAGEGGKAAPVHTRHRAAPDAYVQRPFLVRGRVRSEGQDGNPGTEDGAKPAAGAGVDELPLNAAAPLLRLNHGSVIAVYGRDDTMACALLAGLAPLEPTFLLPAQFSRTREMALERSARALELCPSGLSLECSLAGRNHVDLFLLEGDVLESLTLEGRESFCRELVRVQCPHVVLVRRRAAALLAEPEPDLAVELRAAGIRFLDIRYCPDDARLQACEAGDFFAREICCGRVSPVCWVDGARARQLAQPLLDDADASPLAYPARTPTGVRGAVLFHGCAQFSADGEPALACYGLSSSGLPQLPESFLLKAQFDSACLLLPWLEPAGIKDVYFSSRPEIPSGVVREARLEADALPWLRQEGRVSRLVRTHLSLRDLSGLRHVDHYTPICEGTVVMGARRDDIPFLFSGSCNDGDGVGQDVQAWYESQRMGESWRLLSDVRLHAGGVLEAVLTEHSFIALDDIWKYHSELSAIEGVVQGARMAFSFDPPHTSGPFRLNMAGFVFFGRGAARGPWQLILRRFWDSLSTVSYDAQVTDATGRCFLTVNHLAFDCVPQPAGQ